MDPLSITVSVVGLLGAGINTTKVLCSLIRSYKDAPASAEQCCCLLQSLTRTFEGLQKLQQENGESLELSEDLPERLTDYLSELESIQTHVDEIDPSKPESGVKRSWKRLKWSTFEEQRLQQLFSRLQLYHADFTLVLNCAQLNLQISIKRLLVCKESNVIANRLEETYHPSSPSVSWHPTPVVTYHHKGRMYSATMRVRSVHRKSSMPWDQPTGASHSLLSGRSYSFQINLNLPLAGALRIKYCLLRSMFAATSISTHLELSCPRVVDWRSPIANIVRMGDVASMNRLFSLGKASPFDQLPDGFTMLHIAAARGHLNAVEFLLSCGADVNATDNDGDTPLHLSTLKGESYDVARMLLRYGSDLGIQNSSGRVPVQSFPNDVTRGILLGYDGPLEVYNQDCDGMTIAHYVAYSKLTSPDEIQRLVQKDLHCLALRDCLGNLALHYAIQRGNVALTSYLLDLGVHTPKDLHGGQGAAMIHYATYSRRTEMLDFLLQRSEDMFATDDEGRGLVHHAVMRDNVLAIQKIIELGGAELLRKPDFKKETPYRLAQRFRAHAALEFFESIGISSAIYPAVSLNGPKGNEKAELGRDAAPQTHLTIWTCGVRYIAVPIMSLGAFIFLLYWLAGVTFG